MRYIFGAIPVNPRSPFSTSSEHIYGPPSKLLNVLGALLVVLIGSACGGDDSPCGGDENTCEVFELANQERANANLPSYAWSDELAVAAQLHAEDMVAQQYFDHRSLDGRDFSKRAQDAGYEGFPSGENIAAGQQTPERVMDSWMNSSGHRANILSGAEEIGVGFSQRHWVQVFGSRR